MRQKLSIVIPAAIVLIVLITFVCIQTAAGSSQNTPDIGEDALYVGEHITVTKSDYESYLQRAQLAAPDGDVTQEALNNIAMREIWCYLGKEAGIPDDDEEFAAWLKQYRETVQSADNYGDLVKYFGDIGMTEEEYWQWAETSESFHKEWYATLYQAKLQEEFKAQQSTDPNTTWSDYLRIYKEKALENEHLKKVE